ncbi:DUF2182 domain-containing protein [Streptomyces sp. NPDC048309]|uniref:copper chaperone n=1 Tax=Streptomyces sp. NPDC048309 TaxID=3154618 RepID=UPI00340D428B
MARQPTAGRASASALRRLVSFGSFFALWVSMMAAMMLPGAAPATLRRARTGGGRGRAVPLFVGSYLAVWALAGVAVYAVTGRTDRSPPARW